MMRGGGAGVAAWSAPSAPSRAVRARGRPAARRSRRAAGLVAPAAGAGARWARRLRRCVARGRRACSRGAALAQARLAALDGGGCRRWPGARRRRSRDPARAASAAWRNGSAVARVRLVGRRTAGGGLATDALDGDGAVAYACADAAPAAGRAGRERAAAPGHGRAARALRGLPAPPRRRTRPWRSTSLVGDRPRAAAGWPGALDAVRERAARGLGAGLRRPRRRCCAAWCSARTRRSARTVRTDFQRSGLAHLLAVSGQNVLLLCTLVLALGALCGAPAARRGSSPRSLLVALYVPLAGGGPSIQRAGVMGDRGARGGARRAAGLALVRARPRRRGHARAQPARGRRAGLAALVRRRRRPARARARRCATRCIAARCCPVPSPRPRRSRSRRRSRPRRCWRCTSSRSRSRRCPRTCSPRRSSRRSCGSACSRSAAAQVAPALAAPLNAALRAAARLRRVGGARCGRRAARGAVPVRGSAAPVGRSPRALRRRSLAGGLAAARGAGSAARRGRWPRARRAARSRRGGAAPPRASRPAVLARRARRAGAGLRAPAAAPGELVVSFLDVGQGDATLLQRDGGVGARRHRPARRPDPAAARRGRACERLDAARAHARRGRPRGHGAAGDRARIAPRLVLDGGAGWPTAVQRGLPAALARGGGRAVAARAGQVLRLGALRLQRAVAAAAARPAGGPTATRTTARSSRTCATARSTCCCPPTRSPTSPPRSTCRGSRRSRSPTTAAPTRACPRCSSACAPRVAAIEVGAPQHLRPSDAVDARRAARRAAGRPHRPRRHRARCTSPAGACGWSAATLRPDRAPHLDSAAVPAFRPPT